MITRGSRGATDQVPQTDCRRGRGFPADAAGCLRELRPWSILGALTAAAALAVLGHATPAEAADVSGLSDPVQVASITSVVSEALYGVDQAVSAADPVALPFMRGARAANSIDDNLAGATRSGSLAATGSGPATSALLVPLRPTSEIVRSALADVGDTLPTPLASPVGVVAAALPQTPAAAAVPAVRAATPGIGPRSSAGLFAGESSVELRSPPTRRAGAAWAAMAPAADAVAQAVTTPAPGWWPPVSGGGVPALPSLPPLPVNGPGFGGVAPAGGLGSPALAWVAILTILVALVASARARLGAPATLRSASFVTRTERPG